MEARTRNPYQETVDNIFLLRVELGNLNEELKRVIANAGPRPVQAQSYDIKTGGGKVENVMDLYGLITDLHNQINKKKKELERYKERKKKIEEQFMLTLNETERKVFIMKRRNIPLVEIAYKTGREEKTIKNVSSLIEKKMVEWFQNLQKTEFSIE